MIADLRNPAIFGARAFDRADDGDDRLFYRVARLVPHLDSTALAAIEHVIGSLLEGEAKRILDLMASWDSHLPASLRAAHVVGLGLNRNELAHNPALEARVLHDLNRLPELPFADHSFDAVLCTVSVDYLTHPFEVFAEAARVLEPGGLLLVVFSNRYFPEKVVRVWREASEAERVMIVEDYFRSCATFEGSQLWVSQGRPRPDSDRYSGLGIPSDPVYAVWARTKGGSERPRRTMRPAPGQPAFDPALVARRTAEVGRTLNCPYCDARLRKWAVPQTPFTEWDEEFMYICFNDQCPYLVRGWDAMSRQGNHGISYRLMYNPGSDRCLAVPVPGLRALRDGIVGDEEDGP